MKAEEITYNSKAGTFHPHIHTIFEVKPSYFRDGYLTKESVDYFVAVGVGR